MSDGKEGFVTVRGSKMTLYFVRHWQYSRIAARLKAIPLPVGHMLRTPR